METIYLAGKITGDPDFIKKFNEAAAKLEKPQRKIINPVNQLPAFGITIWLCYMIPAIRNVWKSNKVYFLPDWTNSKGATIEHFCAWIFRKEIYYIQERPIWYQKMIETPGRWFLYSRVPGTRLKTISKIVPKYVKR